nr:NADH dehydrogenase subunit 3 [Osculotes curta]
MIFLWVILILVVIVLLLGVSILFSSFLEKDKTENLPFECGMDAKTVMTPFYMHFFFIAVLFLVFDVELSVTLPLIFLPFFGSSWNFLWVSIFFLLFLGLVLEVIFGTLDFKE